jgi:hypothetical protein
LVAISRYPESCTQFCDIIADFLLFRTYCALTGSGKTTLLSQLGLDFAQQGRPTLWGSFEVKNERLMGKMMQQFHKTAKINKLTKAKLHQVRPGAHADMCLVHLHVGHC